MADTLRTAGFSSLFARFNKAKNKEAEREQEGVVEELGELTLDKDDQELLQLKSSWEKLYSNSTVYHRIHNEGDINERYWIGKQFPDTEYENGKRPLTDNVIYEALETMIPLATQQNPEPVVMSDNSLEMKEVSEKVHMALEYLATYNNLKTKLKKGVRHWSLRYLGAWQVGWDAKKKEIVVQVRNPKELTLDPNGYIEDGVYVGEFLGVKMTDTAANLIVRFPKKKDEITQACQDKLGSIMAYTQWWDGEGKYVFYTLKDIVLQKSKNPHWNYDQETATIDEFGQPIQKIEPGKNHFTEPEIPFVFLTVFDLGNEPADNTSLVSQSLVTQDNINKRLKQIDRNTDNINGGIVVNGNMFNKDQAAAVAEARRQGRTVVTPGNPNEAVLFPRMEALPDSLYENLNDQRTRLMQRFGAAGSTSEGTSQEETVRGKIIAGNNDSSRIGGGVSEYLEVAASRVFNWWVQMMYVYYDEPHLISVIGPNNASQMITLEMSELPFDRKLFVNVQTGSMVPQDELSLYNEAMSLWEGGALDPLSLFEKLKDPNPQERAEKLMMFKMAPQQYMAQYLQVQPPPMPMQPMPQGGGGSTSGQPPPAIGGEGNVPLQAPQAPTAVGQEASNLLKQVPV